MSSPADSQVSTADGDASRRRKSGSAFCLIRDPKRVLMRN
jgi:hypothetical protein